MFDDVHFCVVQLQRMAFRLGGHDLIPSAGADGKSADWSISLLVRT